MLEELHSHKFVGGVGGMSGAGARSLFFGRQLDWGSREVWRGAMPSWFRRLLLRKSGILDRRADSRRRLRRSSTSPQKPFRLGQF